MKALLAGVFGASVLVTAAVYAMANDGAPRPTAPIYAGAASIILPATALATTPATADLRPSLTAEQPALHRPVRVVLASPYAVR